MDAAGYEYFSDKIFDIESVLDKRLVPCQVGKPKKGQVPTMKDYPQYLVLWKGYSPESASWQWPTQRGVTSGIPRTVVDEFEVRLEAEAQLDLEEAASDLEDGEEDE